MIAAYLGVIAQVNRLLTVAAHHRLSVGITHGDIMKSKTPTEILQTLAAAVMAIPDAKSGVTMDTAQKRASFRLLQNSARDYYESFLTDAMISSSANLSVTKEIMIRLACLAPKNSIKISRLMGKNDTRYVKSAIQLLNHHITVGNTDKIIALVPEIVSAARFLAQQGLLTEAPMLSELVFHAIKNADMGTLLISYDANNAYNCDGPIRIFQISREAALKTLSFVTAGTNGGTITYDQSLEAYKAVEGSAIVANFAEDRAFKKAHGELLSILEGRWIAPRQEALDALAAQLRTGIEQSGNAVRPD